MEPILEDDSFLSFNCKGREFKLNYKDTISIIEYLICQAREAGFTGEANDNTSK